MLHHQLTEKIIGCCFQVYNTMGFGYEESVYEKCLLIELKHAGIRAEAQVPIQVSYRGESVGFFRADLLVEGLIIVELKSIRTLSPLLEAQLVNYLKATGKDLGLLINFGAQKVEVKRRTRELGQDE
jgi:GxxExxY protein